VTDFNIGRRDLLRATGATALFGSTGLTSGQATSGGDKLWEFETGGDVRSSPTVIGSRRERPETVFVGSIDNSVYALEATTGEQAWAFETGGSVLSSPSVIDGTVYVGSMDDRVYALDAEDGFEEWTFETNFSAGIRSSPTVTDGTVYVGSEDLFVYALDAATGNREWERGLDNFVSASPTVVDGTVYIGSSNFNVHALDAETGFQEWVFETDEWVESSPTVADGTVYVGSFDTSVYALDADGGFQQWTFETGDWIRSSPTVVDGTVYIGSQDNSVYALDAATGDKEWEFETGNDVWSSPTVVDGTVYVGSRDNSVYALDAATGDKEWEFETGASIRGSSPTVVDGVVYVGSNDGRVYALDAGVEGSSEGSRVNLGTLGHHHVWAGEPDLLVVDGDADEDDPEYQTIQAAVDDAADEDIVEVRDGTYGESVALDGDVTVRTDEGAVVVPPGNAPAFTIDTATAPDTEPTVRGFVIEASGDAIDFSGADGDWLVERVDIVGASVGVRADDAHGAWRVHRVNFLGMTGQDDVHVLADDSPETEVLGNARRNWYAGDGGGSTPPDCRPGENVLCGNPLGEPASDDATGTQVTVLDDTGDNPTPAVDVAVYLFDVDAGGDIAERLAELDGRQVIFDDEVLGAASRAVATGPDGIVRYTGLDAGEYRLLVAPPDSRPGLLHTRTVDIEATAVEKQTVELTNEVFFEYIRDDPGLADPVQEVPVSDPGEALRRDTLELCRLWAQAHVDERVRLLEQAHGYADVLEDSLTVETEDEGIASMFTVGGDVVGEIGEKGTLSRADFRTTAIDLVITWASDPVARYFAGWGKQRFEDAAAAEGGRYEDYGLFLDEEWIYDPGENPTGDYGDVPPFTVLSGEIDSIADDIDTARASPDQLPAEFNHAYVRDVFRQLRSTLGDRMVPEGAGREPLERDTNPPTDLVVLPDGSVYNARKAAGPLDRLEDTRDAIDESGLTETLSNVFTVAGLAGTVLLFTPFAPVGKVIVIVATVGGVATDLRGSIEGATLQDQFGSEYVTLHLDALHDAESFRWLLADLQAWFTGQFENPVTGTVDGSITELADVPETIQLDEDETTAEGQLGLFYQNEGDEPMPTRARIYTVYQAEGLYDGVGEPPTSGQAAPYLTTFPSPERDPLVLDPGSTGGGDVEYVYHHPPETPLGFHIYNVELFVGGVTVDTVHRTTAIEVPAAETVETTADDIVPAARYAAGPDPAEVGQTLNEYRVDSETVLETRLDPGETAQVTVTTDSAAVATRLFLLTAAESAVEMSVEGATAGGVGQSEAALSVASGEEVTVTVAAAGTETRPVSATVVLAETPDRPPVLGVVPGGVFTVADPGRELSPSVAVTEVGYQEGVDGLDAELDALTNADGTQFPGTASATLSANALEAGERQPVAFSVAVDEAPELDGEPTRFSGGFTCSGEETSVTATVSVLVLDTDIDGARLADADNKVTAARLAAGELPAGAPEPPGELVSVYEVSVEGDAEAAAQVSVPESLGELDLSAFWLAEDGYEPAEYFGGTEHSTVAVPTGEHDLVVVEFEGPPPLPGFDRPPQDLNGDGLYRDIDGDGEFDIFDVQAFFNTFQDSRVQNNPQWFDFDGDDEVTIADVQALFEDLTE